MGVVVADEEMVDDATDTDGASEDRLRELEISRNWTEAEPLAFSIKQFCALHNFSMAKYFLLKKAREGPAEMKIGRRVLITREAAARWRRQRERITAEAAKATHAP